MTRGLGRAPLWRGLGLGLWGIVLLQSAASGRLSLLLREVIHPLVWLAGGLLVLLGGLQLALAGRAGAGAGAAAADRVRRGQVPVLLATAVFALLVLALPPTPSFADLAGQRPRDTTSEAGLSFVLPPAQRSLTDWVRLLRSQPDPRLFVGDPVRISGFVLPVPGEPPQLARLLVRCCLADATPVGLPVRWPAGSPRPRADQWLAVEGRMGLEQGPGGERLVVLAFRIRPIPRPARPLEP
ncbi:MAG: TIGR03943 family putative permease subunit [Synechococcus sp.]